MKKKLAIATFILLLLFVIVFKVVAPRVVRTKAIEALKDACGSCTLGIGHVSTSLFPLGLSFSRIQFSGGDPLETGISAQVEKLSFSVAFMPLFKNLISIDLIHIQNPEVEVSEGDRVAPPSKEEPPGEPPRFKWLVKGTELVDGGFSYVRTYPDRNARLTVRNLQGTIDSFGNTDELLTAPTTGKVTGRLENSGNLSLSVKMPILVQPPQVDVELKLNEQNLADISPFFKNSSGVEIVGSLYLGHGLIRVRDQSLQGWVKAQYHGLQIKMLNTKERSALASFLGNVVASIKMDPSDIGEKPLDQRQAVALTRKKKESVLQFVLRGLQEAAMQVAGKH